MVGNTSSMSTTTTTTTEILCSPSSAPTIPTTTVGKLRYVPAGRNPTPSPHNFHLPANSEFGDVRTLPLHDLRPLPSVEQLPNAKGDTTAQLSTHAFTAVRHPSAIHSAPYTHKSWTDPSTLEKIYVPETEDMVKRITGAKKVVTEGFILRMRSEIWTEEDALAIPNAEQGQKRTEAEEEEVLKAKLKESMKFPQYIGFSIPGGAPPAQNVHIDYTPNGARTHIRKYHPKLRSAAADIIKAEVHLLSKALALKERYSTSPDCPRWALFSIWRPLKPVKRDPLGLGDIRSFAEEDFVSVNVRWPNLGVPGGTTDVHEVEMHLGRGSERHRWCWVSNQQPEEAVVIGLFDSHREKESAAAGGVLESGSGGNGA